MSGGASVGRGVSLEAEQVALFRLGSDILCAFFH